MLPKSFRLTLLFKRLHAARRLSKSRWTGLRTVRRLTCTVSYCIGIHSSARAQRHLLRILGTAVRQPLRRESGGVGVGLQTNLVLGAAESGVLQTNLVLGAAGQGGTGTLVTCSSVPERRVVAITCAQVWLVLWLWSRRHSAATISADVGTGGRMTASHLMC